MMDYTTINDRRYAQFARLCTLPGLTHAFATRPLDVSPRVDQRYAERAARRAQMARDWSLDAARVHHCVQIHQTKIAIIDDTTQPGGHEGYDALVTNLAQTPLMTFSADCPLVLLYDPRRRVLGLAHASWRCTTAQLVRRLVDTMTTHYDCAPTNLQAGIGPGAGPCCYEVGQLTPLPPREGKGEGRALNSQTPPSPNLSPKGERGFTNEVYQAAHGIPRRDDHFTQRDGGLYFDLWQANAAQLAAAGVPHENIELAEVCTMCNTDIFYSFRREGTGCGHFGLLAALT